MGRKIVLGSSTFRPSSKLSDLRVYIKSGSHKIQVSFFVYRFHGNIDCPKNILYQTSIQFQKWCEFHFHPMKGRC